MGCVLTCGQVAGATACLVSTLLNACCIHSQYLACSINLLRVEPATSVHTLDTTTPQNGHLEEALPLQLLALELLLALLGTDSPDPPGPAAAQEGASPPASPAPDGVALVRQAAAKLAATAQSTASALAAQGWEGRLPDVVSVVHRCALPMGRGGQWRSCWATAVVQHMRMARCGCCMVVGRRIHLGGGLPSHDGMLMVCSICATCVPCCCCLVLLLSGVLYERYQCTPPLCAVYAVQAPTKPQAGTLLYFLCTDLSLFPAGEGLRLDDSQRAALHRLVLHTSARMSACRHAGGEPGPPV